MMMPSIFGESLFDDDWMDFPFEREFFGKKNPLYGRATGIYKMKEMGFSTAS